MTITEVPKMDTDSLVKDGKNAKQLVCENCPSKILPPGIGTYEEIEFDLPCALQKKQPEGNAATGGEPSELAKEKITQYFRVEDKFDFDNAAFTKTVDSGIKFLCCVDCSLGPTGWHDTKTEKCYIALTRVKHQD